MSSSYSTAELEARIAELENRVQRQDRKIRALGTIAVHSQSSPFQDPLKRFFEEAEFWEVIYEDFSSCFNRCWAAYRQAEAACDAGDTDCLNQARDNLLECRSGCGDPNDPFDGFL